MSVFHEVEKDVLWYNRILLRRVFDVLKQQWQLKDVLKRVQSGSLQEGECCRNSRYQWLWRDHRSYL